MVKWGGLNKLPHGTTVLDVGCGIGGSSRILAKDYGFEEEFVNAKAIIDQCRIDEYDAYHKLRGLDNVTFQRHE